MPRFFSFAVFVFFVANAASATQSPTIGFFKVAQGSQLQPVETALFGEKIVLQVSGLNPKETCALEASQSFGAKSFRSEVILQADETGSIRTDQSKPVSGGYAKADADGLFWSMKAGEPEPSLQVNAYTFQLKCPNRTTVTTILKRSYFAPGVRVIDLEGTGLVGKLYLPAKELGPRPAVIAFSGSEGGADTGMTKALYLANQGYVGLGIAYFNAPGLPKDLANIPLEYFEKAISYLQSRPEVQADKIAVMGVSRGGELALLLGATFPQVKAVIGQVPGPVKFGGNASDGAPTPAWTYHGQPLSSINVVGDFVKVTLPDGREVNNNRPAFEEALKDKEAVEKAFTPIEKINGPVLLFGGEDDQVWPSCVLVEMAMARLRNSNHPFADESVCYKGAGHGIGDVPGGPTTETAIFHPAFQIYLNLGGAPDTNAFAIRDSWGRVLEFLKRQFN